MNKKFYYSVIIVTAGLGFGFIEGCATGGHVSGSGPITVFGAPIVKTGTADTCPGAFSGFICYTQALPAWGWAPDTNTTMFTAANGGQCTDARVEFVGSYGDTGCNLTNVIIPNPPLSPNYVFYIYFRSNTPTTNYPIILTGFNTNN